MSGVNQQGRGDDLSLPYDVVIDESGIYFGPAGTAPRSRDWVRFSGDAGDFFRVISRPDFDLNVTNWRVRAS